MSKPIHSAQLQILLVKKYLSGEGSYRFLTAVHGISERSLRRWVLQYREQRGCSVYREEGNRHYSIGEITIVQCNEFIALSPASL